MEILRQQRDGFLELSFEGRLDGYWAQHLTESVAEAMREGAHNLRLNLSRASYISSAGIGVLVEIHKRFAAVNGTFGLVEPAAPVRRVIDLVGLREMLLAEPAPAAAAAPAPAGLERKEAGNAVFEIHPAAAVELTCRLLGDPGPLASAGFGESHCRSLSLADDRLALGLGAFGESFAGCRERFGEFLAVAGAAACQPTGGANFPDYELSSGDFVPRLSALYALSCEGEFARVVRFESASGKDPVRLSAIVRTCLEAAGAETAAVVVIAESAGLMGAALKRSPTASGAVFSYPEVRQWLNFSPERCFPHALALIAGVASINPPAKLSPFVRPIAANLHAHLHAAVFGYRPLPKAVTELKPAVRSLFDAGGLQGVLHILADDREIAGAGESELLRGACWTGPIRHFLNGDQTR